MNAEASTLFTIGHSNRPLETFIELLLAHHIRCIADVRAFPSSRRWPQFNRAPLAAALQAHGVGYEWLPALGGRRRPSRPDSPHTAWKVASFRNYADYMDTEEFARGLDALRDLARQQPMAFMCAEALYWQCHRRLIADRLVLLGDRVLHITGPGHSVAHHLPDFARLVDGRIIYDRGESLVLSDKC